MHHHADTAMGPQCFQPPSTFPSVSSLAVNGSASHLFLDGLRMISGYLSQASWVQFGRTCRCWSVAAATASRREMMVPFARITPEAAASATFRQHARAVSIQRKRDIARLKSWREPLLGITYLWLYEAPQWPHHSSSDRITCPLAVAVSVLPNLRVVNLEGLTVTSLEPLLQLQHLQELDIREESDLVSLFSSACNCTGLTSLRLPRTGLAMCAQKWSNIFQAQTKLQRLKIRSPADDTQFYQCRNSIPTLTLLDTCWDFEARDSAQRMLALNRLVPKVRFLVINLNMQTSTVIEFLRLASDACNLPLLELLVLQPADRVLRNEWFRWRKGHPLDDASIKMLDVEYRRCFRLET